MDYDSKDEALRPARGGSGALCTYHAPYARQLGCQLQAALLLGSKGLSPDLLVSRANVHVGGGRCDDTGSTVQQQGGWRLGTELLKHIASGLNVRWLCHPPQFYKIIDTSCRPTLRLGYLAAAANRRVVS